MRFLTEDNQGILSEGFFNLIQEYQGFYLQVYHTPGLSASTSSVRQADIEASLVHQLITSESTVRSSQFVWTSQDKITVDLLKKYYIEQSSLWLTEDGFDILTEDAISIRKEYGVNFIVNHQDAIIGAVTATKFGTAQLPVGSSMGVDVGQVLKNASVILRASQVTTSAEAFKIITKVLSATHSTTLGFTWGPKELVLFEATHSDNVVFDYLGAEGQIQSVQVIRDNTNNKVYVYWTGHGNQVRIMRSEGNRGVFSELVTVGMDSSPYEHVLTTDPEAEDVSDLKSKDFTYRLVPINASEGSPSRIFYTTGTTNEAALTELENYGG